MAAAAVGVTLQAKLPQRSSSHAASATSTSRVLSPASTSR